VPVEPPPITPMDLFLKSTSYSSNVEARYTFALKDWNSGNSDSLGMDVMPVVGRKYREVATSPFVVVIV